MNEEEKIEKLIALMEADKAISIAISEERAKRKPDADKISKMIEFNLANLKKIWAIRPSYLSQYIVPPARRRYVSDGPPYHPDDLKV